ncbi:NADH-quinone oxidoreductase subunit L [Alteromonas sp. CYL-A6]|uniref:NADH-quinone oxidoreductase subunit L n=1 Tax=Alteromonas nitratireducens TaxID=3390813 RepID=UPI0034BAEC9A
MSSLSVSLSLFSLPLFWVVLSWVARNDVVNRHPSVLQKSAIAGTLLLFLLLPLLSVVYQPEAAGQLLLKLTPVSAVIISLVVFIGITLIRFSRNYMAGERCYPVFFRWMKLVLAAVVMTLMANHLFIFWLGWVAISLSLHRLLLLYPERPRAVLAAHKKFILARCSEVLMLVAFTLLYEIYDTAYIDALMQSVSTVSLSQQQDALAGVAAVLIAIAALLKCAQLPFHGWLINVVESPTPVSALLHAGIINLGGYLLLVFSPLLAVHATAQWVVLIGAGMSVLCAGLIMTTRVSIKVRLAWSTSSQMGLMLIECALGLYSLAMLHLVTHSLYKAHAFLNSGDTVYAYLGSQIAGRHQHPAAVHWLGALLVSSLIVATCVWLAAPSTLAAPWVLLWLALTSLLVLRSPGGALSHYALFVALALVLTGSYALGKDMFSLLLYQAIPGQVLPFSAMDIWISSVFFTLFIVSWILHLYAGAPAIRRVRQALFAGLYLDEWFTRATLRLWPVTLRRPSSAAPNATVTNLRSH